MTPARKQRLVSAASMSTLVFTTIVTLAGAARAADVNLAWDANTEAMLAGYKLYYDTDQQGAPYEGVGAEDGPSPIQIPLESLKDPGNPQFTLHGLKSCQRYYIAVTAYDKNGGESAFSIEAGLTVMAKADPVLIDASAPTSLSIAWSGLPANDSGSIPRYRIHYDTKSGGPYMGSGSPVEVTASSLSDPAHPSYVLDNLTTGTTYYVVVEGVCDDGTTKSSKEASGAPGTAGMGGAGGSGGEGGSAQGGAGGAGGAGGSGAGAGLDEADNDAGCGCRMGGGEPLPWGASSVLVGVMVSWARRRRRGAR